MLDKFPSYLSSALNKFYCNTVGKEVYSKGLTKGTHNKKKWETEKTSNFGGITLVCAIMKIFEAIVEWKISANTFLMSMEPPKVQSPVAYSYGHLLSYYISSGGFHFIVCTHDIEYLSIVKQFSSCLELILCDDMNSTLQ